ncbi:MAG: alternative oxidase [Sulfuricaulis sp.]|uniref:alternative oxidase n=1 Tax=Sulfuricaulis sp. TaxID=2003553 RepID=UPI0025D0F71D|nr:alternative oxidase [Sulfuricaulis sp.]MCR4348084.1 alternative oxidase [Sulfuricaulis sp.]
MAIHHVPKTISDYIALAVVKAMRVPADLFFAKRYGHRAVVLETVAAVPGMVGGTLQHLRSLRTMQDDRGKIKTLLDEAENERMHLMTFIEIAKPTWLERMIVLIVQGLMYNLYFFLYLITPKTCHRIVGYLEEEAIVSYTEYLAEIGSGSIKNIPAPHIAIEYWRLPVGASLHDLVIAIRGDEVRHRDVNHAYADRMT